MVCSVVLVVCGVIFGWVCKVCVMCFLGCTLVIRKWVCGGNVRMLVVCLGFVCVAMCEGFVYVLM